jgi:ubiquinone/menaquinone biosynthesis C-methylase UbiE
MISYNSKPIRILQKDDEKICSFIADQEVNLDNETVKSFGEEWLSFHDFSREEIQRIGNDYFDILPDDVSQIVALDVGCGSGRWGVYLAPKVKFIEGIDPSSSVWIAKKLVSEYVNVRITHASVQNIPFPDDSFDLVYSLGVLHHVPNTQMAIQECFHKTKKGGSFLVYLYYNFENRGFLFKTIFWFSNLLRKVVSRLWPEPKRIICNIIAASVYWPLAKFGLLISSFSNSLSNTIPLSYYKKTSFFVMRNDALDRFGTPLEKRFSKRDITTMLSQAGFTNIRFSTREPYWHVIAQKP